MFRYNVANSVESSDFGEMKIKRSFLLLLVLFAMVIYFYLISKIHFTNTTISDSLENEETEQVTIALVVCGSRSKEALVMMKSAIIFQNFARLEFVVLSEFHLQAKLRSDLKTMQVMANNSFTFRLLNLSFPVERINEWRYLFQPCATQRLFLPKILEDLSTVLYVDTDALFLNDLSDIWGHFKMMNSSQMAALVPEHEDPNIGWYNRFARHPYYGKLGVNSGVMLMNLTKMREFKWVDQLEPILTKFKLKLTWGDQDIINIIFHYHPEKLYIYPCRYNYRTDHCMYKSDCKDAESHGVSVLHGSRGAFYSDKQKTFKAIFTTFSEYQMGSDLVSHLIIPLRKALEETRQTNCGSVMDIFIKNLIRMYPV